MGGRMGRWCTLGSVPCTLAFYSSRFPLGCTSAAPTQGSHDRTLRTNDQFEDSGSARSGMGRDGGPGWCHDAAAPITHEHAGVPLL